jgi:hypothetical protein
MDTNTRTDRQNPLPTADSIRADYAFAYDNPDDGMCPQGRISTTRIMRYVAAINPDASRKLFVEALCTRTADHVPCHPGTVAQQFANSRKFDAEAYGARFDKAGVALNDY